MNRIKRQHFVPRFYLENFTNGRGKIFAFDIQTLESFPTIVENVSHKKFFYDLDEVDKIAGYQSVERALALFESESAKMFKKLVQLLHNGNLTDLIESDKKVLAEYIIIQQSRTLESRIKGQQLAVEMERQLKSKGATDEFIKQVGLEASNYHAKEQQLFGLLSPDMESRINDLLDRYWIYWDNQTKHKFYSSDHPVVGHVHTEINLSAYEIYFPLTPRFGLSILLKQHFQEWADKHGKIISLRDPENVKFYNSLILINCGRQIYNSEADFRLAIKIVKQNPGLSNPDRQRVARM